MKTRWLPYLLSVFILEVCSVRISFGQTQRDSLQWKEILTKVGEIADADRKVEVYQEFINKHPGNFFVKIAKEAIETIAFDAAKAVDQYESYEGFVSKYPTSLYSIQAHKRIDELAGSAFSKARMLGTIQAWEDFLLDYPASGQATEARNLLKHKVLSGTKILRLELEGDTVKPIQERLISKFKSAGFVFAAEKGQKSGAVLKLTTSRTKRSTNYRVTQKTPLFETGTYFLADHIECSVELGTNRFGTLFIWRLEGEDKIIPLSGMFGRLAKSAVDSLFDSVTYEMLIPEALGALGRTNMLLQYLKTGDFRTRMYAVYALARLKEMKAVEPLISLTRERNSDLRKAAVEVLGLLGDGRAGASIITALTDSVPEVRQTAAEALASVNAAGALEPLITALKDSNVYVSFAASKTLGGIHDQRAAGALAEALLDKDGQVSLPAAEALASIGDTAAVAPLLSLLKDGNWAAPAALAKIGDRRAVDPLCEALHGSDRMRVAAAQALGELGDPAAIRPLLLMVVFSDDPEYNAWDKALKTLGKAHIEVLGDLLKDRDERVRQQAAILLLKLGDPRSLEVLISALSSEDYLVREQAAVTLGYLKDGKAVPALIASLHDRETNVRAYSAISLGRIGDTTAVPHLVPLLSDHETFVRSLTAEALGMMRNTQGVVPLIARLKDGSKDVRSTAAKSLGEIGDARAITPLLQSWRESNRPIEPTDIEARVAIAALGEIGNASFTVVVSLLGHEDPSVRSLAVDALGTIGDRRAVDYILPLVSDSSVRGSAVSAFGELRDPRAVDALILTLQDEDDWVRTWSAQSLGQIGDRRAVVPLTAALKDRSISVRQEATRALGEINDDSAIPPLITALEDNYTENGARACLVKIGRKASQAVIAALGSQNADVRRRAAKILGEMKEHAAIQPLIAAMNNETGQNLGEFGNTLNAITGKNFGCDAVLWEKWWKRRNLKN